MVIAGTCGERMGMPVALCSAIMKRVRQDRGKVLLLIVSSGASNRGVVYASREGKSYMSEGLNVSIWTVDV
jgi:hypothetical protein